MKTIRKIISSILLTIIGIFGVIILVITGIITYDSLLPSQTAIDFTNITYTGKNGQELNAYLTKPEGNGPFPAVIMIHEFFGINQDIILKADELAKQGYIVLAPDAYRNQTTKLVPRAIWLVSTTPPDQIASDLDAAYEYLLSLPEVSTDQIGAVGFCFGGTQVMRMGVRNPDLAAAVIFYGNNPIQNPSELGSLGANGPVLGIYGEEDMGIPLEEVEGFKAALQTQGIEHQITVYPGVGHAFVHADNIKTAGAAQDAWNEMLAFLESNLTK